MNGKIMRRRMSLAAISFLPVALLVILTACSDPDIGQINGRVTVNGNPLESGFVVFSNKDTGVSINANLNADGTYIIKTYEHDGLPPGVYRVAVRSGSFGRADPFGRGKTDDLIDQRPAAPTKPTVVIPEKYRDVNTSGLSATVERGENAPFEFDLK